MNRCQGQSKAALTAFVLVCLVAWSAAAAPYFPINRGSTNGTVSEYEAQWFGKHLKCMGEPQLPMAAQDPSARIFRLTVLPTWGNPLAVRVQRVDGTYAITSRRLSGQGGYNPGKLIEQHEAELSDEDSKEVEKRLTAINFDKMPTDDGFMACDGEEWILEGVSQGRYHVVVRQCASTSKPQQRGLEPFLDLCQFLVERSRLSEGPKNGGQDLLPKKDRDRR